MRRLIFLFLFLLAASVVHAEPETLRIALWISDVTALHAPSDAPARANGMQGLNEDLAREICRRIRKRCVFENVMFVDILPGIEHGRYDIGFGNFLRTPERERRVAFSDSVWTSSSRLLGHGEAVRRLRERAGRDAGLEALRDLRVGAVVGTQQYAYLDSIARRQGLVIRGTRTMAEIFALLREGLIDFGLLPMLPAYDLLQREPANDFEFIGPAVVDHGLGGSVHLALGKDQAALREEVNAAIADLRAEGSYHRLVRRYFPFNIE